MSHPVFNLGAFLEKKTKNRWFKLHYLVSYFEDHPSPHRMGYVLDATMGDASKANASKDDQAVYQTKVDDTSFVQSGMLFFMSLICKSALKR
jgi:hypothetical protein